MKIKFELDLFLFIEDKIFKGKQRDVFIIHFVIKKIMQSRKGEFDNNIEWVNRISI